MAETYFWVYFGADLSDPRHVGPVQRSPVTKLWVREYVTPVHPKLLQNSFPQMILPANLADVNYPRTFAGLVLLGERSESFYTEFS